MNDPTLKQKMNEFRKSNHLIDFHIHNKGIKHGVNIHNQTILTIIHKQIIVVMRINF